MGVRTSWMWWAAGVFALIAVAGVFAFDELFARYTVGGGREWFWTFGIAWLDALTLKTLSAYLLGPILLLAGAVLLIPPSGRSLGTPLLYVGLVQFISTAI